MTEKMKIEDYQTSLTEEQKLILDDAPTQVVQHLFEYTERNGIPRFINLRKRDKLSDRTEFVRFTGADAVNAIDYLKFLVRNGYKNLADAG